MQYNTNQWIILNYPVGAGGKFLVACLMQFDKNAHWSGKSMTLKETVKWYTDSLPTKANDIWSLGEIDTPWVIPASRQWSRGNNLSEHEFNSQLINTHNDYFNRVWREEKFIVDFWHKTDRPAWWTNANWINIVVDDMVLYKKLLLSKLFNYQPDKKIVVANDQMPNVGSPASQLKKARFKNQWSWENIDDLDTFFEKEVTKLSWYTTWDFSSELPNNYILLTELFDVDKVYQFLLKYQDLFGQQVNYNYVVSIHTLWYNLTMTKINQLQYK